MNLGDLSLFDLVGVLVGFGLTLMVFSYIFGDNVLFRSALHIFVGVSAGYAAVVAIYNIIWPQLIAPLLFGTQSERLFVVIPVALAGLLLFKITARYSALGNLTVAYLLGVGMAVAVGGAIVGTIFPQVLASTNLFEFSAGERSDNLWQFVKGATILFGTVVTLIYFHYEIRASSEQRASFRSWTEPVAWMGQIFIAITFGTIFAGVYTAALTAFIERLNFIGDFLLPMIFNL